MFINYNLYYVYPTPQGRLEYLDFINYRCLPIIKTFMLSTVTAQPPLLVGGGVKTNM